MKKPKARKLTVRQQADLWRRCAELAARLYVLELKESGKASVRIASLRAGTKPLFDMPARPAIDSELLLADTMEIMVAKLDNRSPRLNPEGGVSRTGVSDAGESLASLPDAGGILSLPQSTPPRQGGGPLEPAPLSGEEDARASDHVAPQPIELGNLGPIPVGVHV